MIFQNCRKTAASDLGTEGMINKRSSRTGAVKYGRRDTRWQFSSSTLRWHTKQQEDRYNLETQNTPQDCQKQLGLP